MITVIKSIQVKRTPLECFHYIADLRHLVEWQALTVQADKRSAGPVGIGSDFRLRMRFGGINVNFTVVITEYAPGQKMVIAGRSALANLNATVNIKDQDDQSLIDCRVDLYPKWGPINPLQSQQPSVEQHCLAMMTALKAALEATPEEATLSTANAKADKTTFGALRCFTRFGYTSGRRRWAPMSERLEGQHIVLTGANSGIGLAAATELARAGADLTLVVRNEEKAAATARVIAAETGRTNITFEFADLSLLSDTEALVNRLVANNRDIDVLINNAGALFNQHAFTSEGLERSYSLLLIAPWRLTEGLKPLLTRRVTPQDSMSKKGPARVINVVSGGMYAERLNLKRLNMPALDYRGARAYAQCKRALSVLTEMWAEQWADADIVVNAMHPGWSDTPGVQKSLPLFRRLTRLVLRSHAEGADTIVWMAQSTQAGISSGKLFLDREPRSTYLLGNNIEPSAERANLIGRLEEDHARVLDKTASGA